MSPHDPSQVIDDAAYRHLARTMGIAFPAPAAAPCYGAREGAPILIDRMVVPLLSVEALGLWCALEAARAQGVPMSIETAAAALHGDEQRAWLLLDELAGVGCVIAPEYEQQLAEERVAQARAAAEARAASKAATRKALLTVPSPFPAYLAGRFAGTRQDAAATWAGVATVTPLPPRGVPVVYFLLDRRGAVAYIGSSGDLPERLANGHRGKPWDRWEAYECATREAAYWREAAELLVTCPPLNSPHDNVNGRLPALRKLSAAARPGGALIETRRLARIGGAR